MNPIRNLKRNMNNSSTINRASKLISNGTRTKNLFLLSLLALVSFAPHVLAQGFVPLAPITGLTDSATLNMTSTFNPNTLANFFNNLYKYLIGLAATLAVIEIIWGGLEISTKDSVSKQSDGKERIQQALFGLVLVLSPVLVFSIINPSILNLSLNLPPIDLAVPAVSGGANGGTTPPPTVTDPITKCSVTGGDYLKKLTCPSQSALNNFDCGSLILGVAACKNLDQSGNPLCTSFSGYCLGKTTSLTVYRYYKYGVLVGNSSWVPSDVAAATAFTKGCSDDGGVVATGLTSAATAFITSQVWRVDLTNGCSSSYGTIPVDKNQYGGVACFGNDLSCNPPK